VRPSAAPKKGVINRKWKKGYLMVGDVAAEGDGVSHRNNACQLHQGKPVPRQGGKRYGGGGKEDTTEQE